MASFPKPVTYDICILGSKIIELFTAISILGFKQIVNISIQIQYSLVTTMNIWSITMNLLYTYKFSMHVNFKDITNLAFISKDH